MRKRGLRAMAWVMLLAMMFSSIGMPKRAHAAEVPEDALFWTTLEELTSGEVLLVTEEDADANGMIVIDGGDRERIIIRRSEKVETIYLYDVTANQLVVEGGMDCEIRLSNSAIGEMIVTAPQTGGISFAKLYERRDAGEDVSALIPLLFRYYTVMMETKDLRPEIITDEKTTVETMKLLTNTELALAKGLVGEVHIETKDVYGSMHVDIDGYTGPVSVEQNRDENEGTSHLGINVEGCQLSSLSMKGESGSCHVDGDRATVENMKVSGAYSVVTSVDTKEIVLDESATKASVRIYSDVEKVEVKGDENRVILSATANVGTAVVEGDSTKIYGYGKLESAEISGTKANVAVHGTKVEGENDTTAPQEMIDMIARPATPKPSATPKPTATKAPEETLTPVPTVTPTNTLVPTATNTPTPTATNTPTPTATNTPTPTPVVVNYNFKDASSIPNDLSGTESYIQGALTLNPGYSYNGGHGYAFSNGSSIEIQVDGPTQIEIGNCQYNGMDTLTLVADGIVWSQSVAKGSTCGEALVFEYPGEATTLVLNVSSTIYVPYIKTTELLQEPEKLPKKAEYNFKDANSIPDNLDGTQVYTQGALTLNPGYSYNGSHGYAFSNGSSIEIAVDGPTKIEIGNCQYNKMEELILVADGVVWSQAVTVTGTCGEALVFEYPGEATTLVLSITNSIYVPYIKTTELLQEPEELPVKTEYDFRDGSIIPTTTDGKSDVIHGNITIKAGTSNAYAYNGAQHGVQFKAGNSIEIKVDGSVVVEVGDCSYSAATSLTMTNADGTWTQTKDCKQGCYHNGSVVTFEYTGEATTLILAFEESAYVPNIVVTTVVEE